MRKIVIVAILLSIVCASASAQQWLPQNWTDARRRQVYTTPQGSKLIPFPWAMALERADSEELFFADQGRRFGFLPNAPAALPVGIVEDKNADGVTSHLGLTCAACHTRDVRIGNTTYRIDGGGADSDLQGFLAEMSRATAATSRAAGDAKFLRFANRVLGANATPQQRAKLFSQLKTFADGYARFVVNSTPTTPWGRSRTDAFSMIFNRVTSIDLGVPANSRKPDAPVSYPFLWDTSWFDKVQYDGGVPNESALERLGRNVGEVLGVFAQVKITKLPLHPVLPPIMQSTAKRFNLLALEDWWGELRAPKWSDAPELPRIDEAKRARGQAIYNQQCLSCHTMVTPGVRQKVTLVPLAAVGTDPNMTTIAATRMAQTGLLRGVRKNLVPFGERFGATALATAITGHVTISVILTPEISPTNPSPNGPGPTTLQLEARAAGREGAGDVQVMPSTNNDREDPDRARAAEMLRSTEATATREGDNKNEELETSLRAFATRSEAEREGSADREYRARPLDGIWATAPYLHNGSVPTLFDLLKNPANRPRTFWVGDCLIDPVNVGCVSTQAPNQFLFDTTKPGNLNGGHTWGTELTDAQKMDLIEYLKSL